MRIGNEERTTESMKVGYTMQRQDGKNIHHNRLFVVVMDYDPQSLCITGRPELELSVQSGKVHACVHRIQYANLKLCVGWIISVVGEMDENGYYNASYNSTEGLVPANFVQEIEIYDEELISRVAHQVRSTMLMAIG